MRNQELNHKANRRSFLRNSAAFVPAAIAFPKLALGAEQAVLTPQDVVRFGDDIEPLVRLIEETGRGDCFRKVATELKNGVTYKQLMAALYLAGVRNLTTSPGGALHAVFAIQSAHQIGQDAPADQRLLPMFWALDNFKVAQDRMTETIRMPVFRGKLPSSEESIAEFRGAMDAFDPDRTEAAVIAMLKTHRPEQVIEELWKHGARDYRSIGHKAIYVMQAWRTLQNIGWQYAEPALRHVARSLVTYGKERSVNGFNLVGQCYEGNVVRMHNAAGRLQRDWTANRDQADVVIDLMAVIRSADHDAACDLAAKMLLNGTATAQPIWDAVHLIAGEIVLKRTAIRPVHALTSANALRYAFEHSSVRETKLLITLQAVGWMCHFMKYMGLGKSTFADRQIERLKPVEIAESAEEATDAALDKLASDRWAAVQIAFTLAKKHSLDSYVKSARSLVLSKARESHQWKVPAATFEDVIRVTPRWQPHYIAAATCYLRGSSMADSPTAKNARRVLQ